MKNLIALIERFKNGHLLLALIFVSILCVAKDLGGVITLAIATDRVISGSGVPQAFSAMAIVMLSGILIVALDRYVKGRVILQLRQQLLKQYEEKLLTIRMEELENMQPGQLLSQYTGDIQKIGNWFERTLPQIIQLIFYLLGGLGYAFSQSVSLTLSVVPAVAIAMPVLMHIVKKLDNSVSKERKVADKAVHKVGELLTGLEFIKTYNLEETMGASIDQQLAEKEMQDLRTARNKGSMNAVSYFISYLPGIFAGLLGGWYLMQGRITAGFLVGFIQIIMGRVAYALPQFADYLASSRESEVYAARILEYLRKADESTLAATRQKLAVPALIEFSHVRFTYPGRSEVLSDLSFTVHRGEKVALVGPSGCGKSTILRLALGYYADQYEGSIRLFGTELRDYAPAALREKLAPVFQDNFLFAGTVQENLAMLGEPEAVASTMGFSDSMLARDVGDGGNMLSGGQRQRVAIARALMKEAEVYLLDEPMASLDHVTQSQLCAELKRVLAGRTQLMVEHRYEAIMDADRIYYIDGGRVVEQGRHEELMARGGLYAKQTAKGGLDG